jgi:hypothetical protein
MNHEPALEEMTRRGGMVKSPFDMSPEEYADWEIQAQARAREYLFSIGQPCVTRIDGVITAEFSDGCIKRIK